MKRSMKKNVLITLIICFCCIASIKAQNFCKTNIYFKNKEVKQGYTLFPLNLYQKNISFKKDENAKEDYIKSDSIYFLEITTGDSTTYGFMYLKIKEFKDGKFDYRMFQKRPVWVNVIKINNYIGLFSANYVGYNIDKQGLVEGSNNIRYFIKKSTDDDLVYVTDSRGAHFCNVETENIVSNYLSDDPLILKDIKEKNYRCKTLFNLIDDYTNHIKTKDQ